MEVENMFKGKVILAYLVNPPDEFIGGIAISHPKLETLCGRHFVVGTVPENPSDWASGLRISVAFEQIAHYLELESHDDFFDVADAGIPGMGNKSIH